MKAGRGIYDRDDVSFTIVKELIQESHGIMLTSAVTYMGEIKARSISSSQENLMVFTHFLSMWSPR